MKRVYPDTAIIVSAFTEEFSTAIADEAGATLWTLDGPMAAAGQALGLDVRLLAH